MLIMKLLIGLVLVCLWKDEIDEVGRQLWARIKFEYSYWKIRMSIEKQRKGDRG